MFTLTLQTSDAFLLFAAIRRAQSTNSDLAVRSYQQNADSTVTFTFSNEEAVDVAKSAIKDEETRWHQFLTMLSDENFKTTVR